MSVVKRVDRPEYKVCTWLLRLIGSKSSLSHVETYRSSCILFNVLCSTPLPCWVMQKRRRQLFWSWLIITVWLNIRREMHMHRSLNIWLSVFLFSPQCRNNLLILIFLATIPDCYWYRRCLQKWWGCELGYPRAWRKDYSTTRTTSWDRHQDCLFPGPRWLEDSEFFT